VLTQGYRYHDYYRNDGFYGKRDILHKQVVPVLNSTYSDEIELPNLDVGYYCLSLYHGDIIIGSTYFSVQDYVKPPYKIEVATDKKAIFADDTVTFTAKAGFFEGTAVADLDVSFNIWGYMLKTSGRGNAKTNIDGKIEVSATVKPEDGAQGQVRLDFLAEATLPEIGRTLKSTSISVFINDINVKTHAKRMDKNATLSVDVKSITLDKINNGTAKHYYDYLDAPISNKNLSVDIYRVYYVKAQDGDYYDYIEKKTVPRYHYMRMEEKIDSFLMITNKDGSAEKTFHVPNRDNESYFAKITCSDSKGRNISETVYIGKD
jgi:uncharacterized protein YfaS (alpha-2-macroglobulin family)